RGARSARKQIAPQRGDRDLHSSRLQSEGGACRLLQTHGASDETASRRRESAMNLRSWLFIPGDSDKKLGKADGAGADALVLDIEDSVMPERHATARRMVREFLDARPAA